MLAVQETESEFMKETLSCLLIVSFFGCGLTGCSFEKKKEVVVPAPVVAPLPPAPVAPTPPEVAPPSSSPQTMPQTLPAASATPMPMTLPSQIPQTAP